MKYGIRQVLNEAVERSGTPHPRELSDVDVRRINEAIRKIISTGAHFLTECTFALDTEIAQVRSDNGWKVLAEFVGANRCVFFFDPSNEPGMWEFESGKHLGHVLKELYIDDYVVVNRDVSFLLGHSHNDFVIAVGSECANWLRKRMP